MLNVNMSSLPISIDFKRSTIDAWDTTNDLHTINVDWPNITRDLDDAIADVHQTKRDMLHVMSSATDVISGLALRIAELRRRLEELDAERQKVADELDDCTGRFSALAVGIELPKTGSGQMDVQITTLFRRHYNRYFTPKEITEYLTGLNWNVDMPYVRTKLARLSKRGKIRKVGLGRYMHKP